MKWITHTKILDVPLILFPWLIGFFLIAPILQYGTSFIIIAFVVFGLLDSGHVYTTIWRIVIGHEKKVRYFYLFVAIIVFLTSWIYFQVPYFWAFVVYSTLFHHVRQYFGILKWYQKLNKSFAKIQEYALYILSIMPIILFHFRDNIAGQYYTKGDMFLYPNTLIFEIGITLYVILFVTYIAYELKTKNPLPTILAVIAPALLYGFAALAFSNIVLILTFLIIGHTIPYITLMSLSVKRVWKKRIIVACALIIITAIVFGSFESLLEESIYMYGFIYTNYQLTFLQSFSIGLFLTPLFAHFLFDAMVWTRKNKDMNTIVT